MVHPNLRTSLTNAPRKCPATEAQAEVLVRVTLMFDTNVKSRHAKIGEAMAIPDQICGVRDKVSA
jgi:hypothetical protein